MAKNKNKGFSLDKGSDEKNKGTSFNISKDDSSKSLTNFELEKSGDTKTGKGFNVSKEGTSKDSTKFELNKSSDNAVESRTGYNIAKDSEDSSSQSKQEKKAKTSTLTKKEEASSLLNTNPVRNRDLNSGGDKKYGKGKYVVAAILILLLCWYFIPSDEDNIGSGLASEEEVSQNNETKYADADGDGISNIDEVAIGTDPDNPDSDGDGQNDGSEQNSGSDPSNSESTYADADGITNANVVAVGTGSKSSDSDAAIDNNSGANGTPEVDTKDDGNTFKDGIVSLTFSSGQTIYNFATNNSKVDDSDSTLNKLYKELSNSSIKLKIIGHTDSTGDVDFNDNLSIIRAKSVYNFLIRKGYTSSLLSYEGMGESKPISNNKTNKGRQLNRRVEIIIEK